jgi:hypothetical protein
MFSGNSVIKGALIHDSVISTQIASGNTDQRPATANAGSIRYNLSLGKFEGFSDPTLSGNSTWVSMTENVVTTIGSGLNTAYSNGVVSLSLANGLQNLSILSSNGLVSKTGNVYSTINAGTGITINSTTVATNLVGGTGITVNGATISGNYAAGNGITIVGNTISLTAPVSVTLGGTGASNAQTARSNLSAAGVYKTTFTATVAGLLTVTHGLNQQYVLVQIIDNNNRAILPDEITYSNTTTTIVDLSSFTISGTWQVVVVG